MNWLLMVFAAAVAVLASSCVSLVTPEEAPIQVNCASSTPLGVSVIDERQNTGGGLGDRYLGRCRLGLYGIPTAIGDPKMAFSERLYEHLKAGCGQKGVEVVPAASAPSKSLVIRVRDDTWIDFANPLTGNDSILYFNATAEVVAAGRVRASARRQVQRNFRYDANDSLFNQAIRTFQPEISKLVNDPKLRPALER